MQTMEQKCADAIPCASALRKNIVENPEIQKLGLVVHETKNFCFLVEMPEGLPFKYVSCSTPPDFFNMSNQELIPETGLKNENFKLIYLTNWGYCDVRRHGSHQDVIDELIRLAKGQKNTTNQTFSNNDDTDDDVCDDDDELENIEDE